MKLSSLMSPTLNTRQSFPSRSHITACLLNTTVRVLRKKRCIKDCKLQHFITIIAFHLALGRVSLAKTRPTIKAWIRQPDMDCSDMTIIADVHLLVVCLRANLLIVEC